MARFTKANNPSTKNYKAPPGGMPSGAKKKGAVVVNKGASPHRGAAKKAAATRAAR